MIKYILFFTFLLNSFAFFGQNYPEVILPGENKTIESGADTLWILRDAQLKKAIISAKKLQVEEEITKELRNKISLMSDKDLVKDSLILDLRTDRDYYMKNWKECTNDVDLLIKKNQRQKFYTRISLGGVILAFVAGFLIGK
ncbi:MAG: hypothetical protein P1P88_26070 [Bacteroidales bacterium]|nr:hypothetical protein [Bacteroidales bacterium]